MKTRVVLLALVLCCACTPALTGREKGGLLGYALGSGIGAGIGAAAGDPVLGAVAGGPVGAAVGVEVANRQRRDQEIAELRRTLERQQAEITLLREGLRRLGRREWLEP